MTEPDELSLRRDAQAAHHDLDARLREDRSEPTQVSLQQRVESAARARTSARHSLALLERRVRHGDVAAAQRLPAARDRAAAAGDRLMAAMDRRTAADALQRSFRDELTGALRRAVGQQQLERELDRSRRDGVPMIVAFVDVDGLKQVNDTQGHLAGDFVLRAVGRTLTSSVRGYDVLFRFGGDEFVVGLIGLQLPEAVLRFQEMSAALDRLVPGVTFSVGFAVASGGDAVMDVLRRADVDLYNRRTALRSSGRPLVGLSAADDEPAEPPAG